MSKTKIVVIQLKEIIYTVIFVGLGILLILLLIFMFLPNKDKKNDSANQEHTYKAGVYTSELTLNGTTLNLEVVLDQNHINSVQLVNTSEAVKTMYPLVESSLKDIEKQLSNDVSVDDIKVSKDSQYTETLLLDTIKNTLAKAEK
jgi:hypothetical protein